MPILYHGPAMAKRPPDTPQFSSHVREPLQLAPIDDDYALPRHFWITTDLEGGAKARLDVAVDDRGSVRCMRVEVLAPEDGGVTTEMLRNVPVARLLRLGATSKLMKYRRKAGRVTGVTETDNEEKRQFYQRYADARRPKQGKAITDETLGRVAKIYRAAVGSGTPTKAVAEAMNVPRSTAARWVTKARERGILRPALHGRSGEAGSGELGET